MVTQHQLPEGYLEHREELHKREKAKASLVASINRFLEDGVREYTRKTLGAYGLSEWAVIQSLLINWESRAICRIITPLDQAKDEDVVVEFLKFVDTNDGFKWPPLPPKSA